MPIAWILHSFHCILLALFLLHSQAYGSFSHDVCVPTSSPGQPERLYPLNLSLTVFDQIMKSASVMNLKRAQKARTQPKGKLYKYVKEVYMGLQLEPLGPENLAQVLPAIDMALEELQSSPSYSGIKFVTVPILHLTSIACDSIAVLSKFDKQAINVLFGPLNDFSIANAGRFSSAMYNVPIITPSGLAEQLKDKIEFSTLTRVFFTYSDLQWVMKATLQQYGWNASTNTPVGLYASRNLRHRGEGHTSLNSVFQQQSINAFLMSAGYKVFHITADDYTGVEDQFLRRLPTTARVVILCADPHTIRYIMLKAHDLGLTNGEYVFFSMDLFSNDIRLERPWYQDDASPEENEKARSAYRALLTITLRRPDSDANRRFSEEVRIRTLRDYKTYFNDSDIRPFIGLFHDAVKLYAIALEEALVSGIPITEGKKITDLMWNRSFEGVTGIVRIDSNGDRKADYSLLDLDPTTNTFQVVANYFGGNKSMHSLSARKVDWINERNEPPPGIPECGFDGYGCHNNVHVIIGAVGAVVFGVFIILSVTLGIFFYRRAELQALSWIIDWSDLEFPDRKTSTATSGSDSQANENGSKSTDPLLVSSALSPNLLVGSNGGKLPASPVRTPDDYSSFFGSRECSPPRSKRRSMFNKYAGSLGDRKRGLLKFSAESFLTDDHPPVEHGGLVDDNAYQSSNTMKRLQQRFARRSRASEEQPFVVATAFAATTGPGRTGQSGVPLNPIYMKNPSFDYSSVMTKHRPAGGGKKKPDVGDTDWSTLSEQPSSRRKKDSQVSRHSSEMSPTASDKRARGTVAVYKGSKVYLRPIRKQSRIESSKETAVEVNKIKDLNNDHICRLIGVCIEPSRQCFVMEYCPKGSLFDFLSKEQFTMDWLFKVSLMQDICRGLTYLHQLLVPHGNLKSSTCLLDSRFAVKLTDFGLPRIRGPSSQKYEYGSPAYYRNLLWTAPELLPRKDGTVPDGTFKGDVYSFAIICQELIYRKGPFFRQAEQQPEPREIINAVEQCREPSYRPVLEVQEEGSDEVINMIRRAWDNDPNKRPDFRTVGKLVGSDSSENLIDNLLERLQGITTNLEAMVDKRTAQYMDEKKRAEDLLYSMLPKSVASQLIKKGAVEAESFDMVTIYFSDIVGFTALSASSTPMEVVNLLNALYTLFDDIIGSFCVYKVETIGDAYMVASGLPARIGNEHAREIARMSIAFLKAIFEFQIPHRPHQRLELRIGIHSGPVCAGVVGQRMPRYCLFGDTVNTSSRMESNGLPLKIHISQATFDVLSTFRAFIMTKRGSMEMKGKGEQTTYWLHGEESFVVDPVPPGVPLVGGPYDGAVGPIPAGALSEGLRNDQVDSASLPRQLSLPVSSTEPEFYTRKSQSLSSPVASTTNATTCSPSFQLGIIPELSPPPQSHSQSASGELDAKPDQNEQPERNKRRVGVCLPPTVQVVDSGDGTVRLTHTETAIL